MPIKYAWETWAYMPGTCLDLKHSVHLLNASLVNANNAWGQNLNIQVLLEIEALLRLAGVKCGIAGCCDSPVALLAVALCVWSQAGKQKHQSVSKHPLETPG